MRSLLVTSRYPWPLTTGDRLRAAIWIEALGSLGQLDVIAPPAPPGAPEPRFRHRVASLSPGTALAAGAGVVFRGLPVHTLMTAYRGWPSAIRADRAEYGIPDRVVVLLSRLEPWTAGATESPVRVLDAIDSLAKSCAARADAAPGAIARRFWLFESRRMEHLEMSLDRWSDVICVAESEADSFQPTATVIGNGVEIAPFVGSDPRAWDVGFWGRLEYFANRSAVEVLIAEILPALRREGRPVRAFIGGADAPADLRGRLPAGTELISPIEDRGSLLRDLKIALFPLGHGSGQSNKILEAAEAGCAIIATPTAMRGFDALAGEAIVADSAERMVDAALRLLANDRERIERGIALRRLVETHYSREATLHRMRILMMDSRP